MPCSPALPWPTLGCCVLQNVLGIVLFIMAADVAWPRVEALLAVFEEAARQRAAIV